MRVEMALPSSRPHRFATLKKNTVLARLASITVFSIAAGCFSFGLTRGLLFIGLPLSHHHATRQRIALAASAADLEIGQYLKGAKVLETMKYGAKLDLGIDDLPGFVHISNVREERIADLLTVLPIGSEVDVRIMKVKANEVQVTIAEHPMFDKKPHIEFSVGDVIEDATVETATNVAVFVDVGAWVDAYVPADQIEEGGAVPQLLKMRFQKGEKVSVTVIGVSKNTLTASMRSDI